MKTNLTYPKFTYCEKESHSMWAEYRDKNPTSIAIQTTVGDLIESLESDEYNIHIGKDYLTEDTEGYEDFPSIDLNNQDNVLKLFYAPFLHKRDVYQDEHEVRAIISFEDVCEEFLGCVYTEDLRGAWQHWKKHIRRKNNV